MNMRLPGSGPLLAALLEGPGPAATGSTGDTVLADVTVLQLDQALDALRQGHIEFVILEQGDAFLQVAGEGDGPYQVQVSAGADQPMEEIRNGVDVEPLGSIVRAYAAGHVAWRGGHDWSQVPE